MSDSMADFLQTTRSSYDAIAKDYASRFPGGPPHPLDRRLITAFTELVTANGPAPVADLGSGPGSVTALLHDLGVPVFGVDVSPAMVALAREAHPGPRFHVGSMTSLDLPGAALGGILALYSTIHVPDAHLPTVFAEFHRTLAPGAPVLVAFQSGPEPDHLHVAERFGHEIDLDYYMRTPEQITTPLTAAGLELVATVVREPDGEEARPRAFVLARRP
ncbi:SAM-dependent methyltransferase [Streptomyces griseochromogenes]|uniref:Methyltransferase n=1 Tax=Streptomyces griseochromogenes TaxID=68214 RepID=A0A1B1AR51_9ACTN|nr:class I SAM-dependent methyltransferase [Streptomyces griseochromogenes]ANP49051.1 methyltransferase [Streptomyces griseochromogenes]MBP2049430.1 SAM-dependent methyltransferase [Streptomyces griseochromogenes]